MQYATELLLRVYLCLTSNAFSFLLPSHASCMCLLSLTAICYNRSYLMIANAKICHTCSQHVHFANRMQLPAAGCLSHTECHTSVRASPLTADLEPPWTVFVHDCIARRSSFQERPTLPNISLLTSTSCAGLCFDGGSLGASKPTIFFAPPLHPGESPGFLPGSTCHVAVTCPPNTLLCISSTLVWSSLFFRLFW